MRPIDSRRGSNGWPPPEAGLFPGERRQTPDARVPEATTTPGKPAKPPASTPGDVPQRVGGPIAEPRNVHRVEPAFPAGRRGSVILEITIARDGSVEDVRTLRADDGFEAPAVQAVRQWRFEPTVVEPGRPRQGVARPTGRPAGPIRRVRRRAPVRAELGHHDPGSEGHRGAGEIRRVVLRRQAGHDREFVHAAEQDVRSRREGAQDRGRFGIRPSCRRRLRSRLIVAPAARAWSTARWVAARRRPRAPA